MEQITIRNLDDSLVHRLRKIAWAEGISPDETARRLLMGALAFADGRLEQVHGSSGLTGVRCFECSSL
jgi:plasmid stability protein